MEACCEHVITFVPEKGRVTYVTHSDLKKKLKKNSIANLRVIEKRPVVLTANKEHQVFEVTIA